MLSISEKEKLCVDALSSGKVSQDSLNFLKKKYEDSRDKVLYEDTFYLDNSKELYNLLRLMCSTSRDYVSSLESRITYLEGLVYEYSTGVVERNAEFLKNLLSSCDDVSREAEELQEIAGNIYKNSLNK